MERIATTVTRRTGGETGCLLPSETSGSGACAPHFSKSNGPFGNFLSCARNGRLPAISTRAGDVELLPTRVVFAAR